MQKNLAINDEKLIFADEAGRAAQTALEGIIADCNLDMPTPPKNKNPKE